MIQGNEETGVKGIFVHLRCVKGPDAGKRFFLKDYMARMRIEPPLTTCLAGSGCGILCTYLQYSRLYNGDQGYRFWQTSCCKGVKEGCVSLQAGAFRIGDTAGTIDNIVSCKLHRPGSVGFVSKSGGMSNEMYNVLSRVTDGLYEGATLVLSSSDPSSIVHYPPPSFAHFPKVRQASLMGPITDRFCP